MIKDTETYLRILVETTYGFTPVLDITERPDKMIRVLFGGNPFERSMLMGKEARNFQALKHLLRIFARRHGYFCELYVRSANDYVPN
jgi:hypothetical protein